MGESLDHCPPGWIRQSRKRCTQFIHNHMVVDYPAMSSVNFAIPNFWFSTGDAKPVRALMRDLERVNRGEP